MTTAAPIQQPVAIAPEDVTESAADAFEDELAPDACPGCGCKPGDGYTATCQDPAGCGFFKSQLS